MPPLPHRVSPLPAAGGRLAGRPRAPGGREAPGGGHVPELRAGAHGDLVGG